MNDDGYRTGAEIAAENERRPTRDLIKYDPLYETLKLGSIWLVLATILALQARTAIEVGVSSVDPALLLMFLTGSLGMLGLPNAYFLLTYAGGRIADLRVEESS